MLKLTGDTLHKKAVLLVIAHPDDESMTDELYKACSMLKVPLKQVVVFDHPELQDGFGKVWNHTLIAKIVEDNIRSHGIDTVITFDSYGVSGHCNHRDVHIGISTYIICIHCFLVIYLSILHSASELMVLIDSQQNSFEAWELDSSSVLRKYSGPVDIWLSIFMAWCLPHRKSVCLLNEHPFKSFRAMAQHARQWVCSHPSPFSSTASTLPVLNLPCLSRGP
uniref:N-acetylglucosaminylphosphatidylinositol deacetylase n=1 Tax=Chenopodium quinoa TaxID=63459 RepID=A0A803KUE4_CHEQI